MKKGKIAEIEIFTPPPPQFKESQPLRVKAKPHSKAGGWVSEAEKNDNSVVFQAIGINKPNQLF